MAHQRARTLATGKHVGIPAEALAAMKCQACGCDLFRIPDGDKVIQHATNPRLPRPGRFVIKGKKVFDVVCRRCSKVYESYTAASSRYADYKTKGLAIAIRNEDEAGVKAWFRETYGGK